MSTTPASQAGIHERLEQFIASKGLRRTPQRDAILKAAFASDEHFTAEELWDRVRRTSTRSSRATVYRTLALLVDAGLLREIDLGGEETTYDPNFVDKPSHNHLICIDCGKVTEFEDPHAEVLHDCLTRRLGFRPVRQELRIEACCERLRHDGRCPSLIAARLKGKPIKGKKSKG